MNTQNLKVFAERLRTHLESHNLIIKHGQSLDLIAAIPGLRNWPEVNAFPDRVATAQWNDHSANRLAKRIEKLLALSLPLDEIRQALESEVTSISRLKVWPDGPIPGVYVTTSQQAIDAIISRYDAATNGALLYAEEAGQSSEAAIELGEYGLFSRGIDRLPSGTLVVVGPLPLTQESWNDNKDRLNAAADLAYSSSLRVAVLVETPLPENLHSDIDLLLRPDDEGLDSDAVNVLGVVTESGDMQVVQPFVKHRFAPLPTQHFSTTQRLPQVLEDTFKQVIAKRPYGVVVLSCSRKDMERASQLEALIPLTEHAGPAVRIQPTFRHGYGKDNSPLSPYFKGIPIFPSIESAYAHGFRRMIIESPFHGAFDSIIKYARDTYFFIPTYESEVIGGCINGLQARFDKNNLFDLITAILCIADIPNKKSEIFTVCDAYVGGLSSKIPDHHSTALLDYIETHRVVRWEDQLDALLATKKITVEQAKKSLRLHGVEDYLASRSLPL